MIRGTTPNNYADAVVDILAKDFPELRDAATGSFVRDAIARHASEPSSSFEVIVDSPSLANWRLRGHRDRPKRVRLACYRVESTAADDAREERINAALGQIPHIGRIPRA